MEIKFMKKKLIAFIVIGIIIYSVIGYVYLKNEKIKKIDRHLYEVAQNIPFYLGANFNYKGMDKNSYSKDRILRINQKIDRLAKLNNVAYIYTIIDVDGMPTYSFVNQSDSEGEDIDVNSIFMLSFEEVGDDSIDETLEVLKNGKIKYITSSDDYSSYRSVYIVKTSTDGMKYIVGADIMLDDLNKLIYEEFKFIILNTTFILLLILIFILIQDKLNKKLFEKSNYDNLTGVLKREVGNQRLKTITENYNSKKDNRDNNIYIGLFDVVNLTYINTAFGNSLGDKAIADLSGLLIKTFGEKDKIIRINGDQFLTIIENVDSKKGIGYYEKMFILHLNNLNKQNGNKIELSVYKSFERYKKGEEVSVLVNGLFEKIYFQKIHSNEDTNTIENDILVGIKKHEFKVFYQPKVNVKTKEIQFEALMRWIHPEKGFVSPGVFIPVAERSSLIIDLTNFLISQVREDVKSLNTIVSLNISPYHFNKDYFVSEIISKYKDLKNIEFELTEGAFIGDANISIEKMKTLKEMGIDFLIDDFGTGYSSLSYLTKLPVTTLKIDRSFVLSMFKTNADMNVVKTIIQLADNLDLKIIVEGTETIEEVCTLINLGADVFQGYYFGKPENLENVMKKLENKEYLKNLELISENLVQYRGLK